MLVQLCVVYIAVLGETQDTYSNWYVAYMWNNGGGGVIGKKRVKEGLHKQKKSQLHIERGGQGKSSEKQKSAERGREREGGEKNFLPSALEWEE